MMKPRKASSAKQRFVAGRTSGGARFSPAPVAEALATVAIVILASCPARESL